MLNKRNCLYWQPWWIHASRTNFSVVQLIGKMLRYYWINKCMKIWENDPCYGTSEPPSKRPANDKTASKLWGCLSEILSDASALSSEDQDTDSTLCEVERYLAEPLLDFKVKTPFKWWAANSNAYPLLCGLARKYVSALPTNVASERVFLAWELYMVIEEV